MTYEQKMLEEIAKQLKRIANSLEKLQKENYFNTGNCFKSEQEAEEYKENLLTKQQLKDLALELNNGVEIDWENENQKKYYLEYGCYSLDYDITYSYINLGQIYCLNEDFLKIAKDRIGEEKIIKLIKSGV